MSPKDLAVRISCSPRKTPESSNLSAQLLAAMQGIEFDTTSHRIEGWIISNWNGKLPARVVNLASSRTASENAPISVDILSRSGGSGAGINVQQPFQARMA